MNKQELITAMQHAYVEWTDLLEQIPGERLTEPNAVGSWTVKDVIAHIAADHRWLAAQLEAAAHRQMPTATECFGQEDAPPPEYNFANNQDRNDWNYQRHRNWSLEAVMDEADFAYNWLVRMIEELPEPAFGATYTIAEYDNINHVRPASDDDDFRFPLWSLLFNGTAEHYPDHVRDVRDWLERGN